ncbi:hypothetical protein BC938DRAFT_471602 [Jimgerdemannia flammicorona]|uniref:NodB homology domain-containing protein n=1 Tax=Jimgerdemannia flammicorona TaxID=994334 RepID=A0A433Q7S7_9FUNG|nr:hypothetical protein BC938DRAFT_471602 [Jimgerdemannia flammicorona]
MSSRLLSIAAIVTLFVTIASAQGNTDAVTTSTFATASAAASPTTTATTATTSSPAYPNNYHWAHTYPPLFDSTGAWAVPPTNSTEVATWYALVNATAIPAAPVIQLNTAGDPISPYPAGQNPYCDWSIDGVCSRPNDVVRCPDKGVWGLTYDDGPTEFSPALYDFLAKSNQKATLFMIGLQVAQYPLTAKAACDAARKFSDAFHLSFVSGHQIGIHTWSHHALTSLTNEQIVAELKWTETIIKEVCGLTPR